MKLAVYYIIKNEQNNIPNIQKVIDALRPGDVVCILDTGSNYDQLEAVSALASSNVFIEVSNESSFRYDRARIEAMAMTRNFEVDMSLWVDADETLSDGWRDLVEQVDTNTAYSFSYVLGDIHYHQIRLTPTFDDRITWKYAAHEALDLPEDMKLRYLNSVTVTQPPKERTGTLVPLLLQSAKEYQDHRSYYYLAREYKMDGEYTQALCHLDFCDRFTGSHDEYRAGILAYDCYMALGDTAKAERQLLNCMACYPNNPEAYALMAFDLYNQHSQTSEYEYGYFARKALACTKMDMEDVYTCRAVPLTLLARIFNAKNEIKQALDYVSRALILCPEADDIKAIMAWYIKNHPDYFKGDSNEEHNPK